LNFFRNFAPQFPDKEVRAGNASQKKLKIDIDLFCGNCDFSCSLAEKPP
jgi:hypothetical protein